MWNHWRTAVFSPHTARPLCRETAKQTACRPSSGFFFFPSLAAQLVHIAVCLFLFLFLFFDPPLLSRALAGWTEIVLCGERLAARFQNNRGGSCEGARRSLQRCRLHPSLSSTHLRAVRARARAFVRPNEDLTTWVLHVNKRRTFCHFYLAHHVL